MYVSAWIVVMHASLAGLAARLMDVLRCWLIEAAQSSSSGPDYTKVQRNLALELVRVTEAAALASGRWFGKGDKNAADQVRRRSARCS
jgi:hypothetical protein